jgi:hypothetical protein
MAAIRLFGRPLPIHFASIRRVLPICHDITLSSCFTGAETEKHNIKDDSKIDREN